MSSTLVAVLAIVTTSSAAEPGDAPRRPEPPPAPRVMPKPPAPRRAAPPPAPSRPEPPPAPKPPAPPAPSASAEAESNVTDHERVLDRIGVGWFGVSNVMVGTEGDTLVAPTLGARFWLDGTMGVDVALGLVVGTSGGERMTPVTTMDVEGPSTFGILGHAGLPLAFHSSEHYTFLVIPEVNVGFGRIKDTVGGGTTSSERSQTGLRLEVGARAGAEIQFGFIGVPELALEASVGVRVSHQRLRRAIGDEDVLRVSATGLQTLSVNDPWDFFRSTVAARYYF